MHQSIVLKHYDHHEWTVFFFYKGVASEPKAKTRMNRNQKNQSPDDQDTKPRHQQQQNPGSHLQTPPWTVLGDDADVGRVDAGSDEPRQVVELNVAHLKITTNTIVSSLSLSLSLSLLSLPHRTQRRGGPRKTRSGEKMKSYFNALPTGSSE